MSIPYVSVVVPAYNAVHFIAATMDSILAQTFTDFELIVSDHSSDDGTWEVLEGYRSDPRVTLHRLAKGGGAAANWNSVSTAATGELIKLVCSDDLVYPTCLAEQVMAMDAHPTAVFVSSTRDIVDAGGHPLVRGRGLGSLSGLVDGRAAIRATVRAGTNLFGEPASVLFRREVLAAAGFWDSRYSYLIDQASYVRVLLHGDMVAIPRPLAGFRVSAQQWSVHLMRTQAAEAREYHRALNRDQPGLLSRVDLRRGNAMAAVNMLMRRAAYLYLGRRMRSAAPV